MHAWMVLALLCIACCEVRDVFRLASEDVEMLQSWCAFERLPAMQLGEPVLISKGVSMKARWKPWSLKSLNISGNSIVEVEWAAGTDIKPYGNRDHGTFHMKWAAARKLLASERHQPNGTFTFYYHQQRVAHSRELLGAIADELPPFLTQIRPDNLMVWASGFNNHTTYLHYDGADNAYMLLRGKKRVVLYAPWDASNIACDRALTENHFPDFTPQKRKRSTALRFPSQPRWLSGCKTFEDVIRYEAAFEAGDILWLPAGWFHTLLSSPGSIAVSLFNTNLRPWNTCVLKTLTDPVSREEEEIRERRDPPRIEGLRIELDDDGPEDTNEDAEMEKVAAAFADILRRKQPDLIAVTPSIDSINSSITKALRAPHYALILPILQGVLTATSSDASKKNDLTEQAVTFMNLVSTNLVKRLPIQSARLLQFWQQLLPGCEDKCAARVKHLMRVLSTHLSHCAAPTHVQEEL